jgi:hypothetical protein
MKVIQNRIRRWKKRRDWNIFKIQNRNTEGFLKTDYATAIAAAQLFTNVPDIVLSPLVIRRITFMPSVGSLYDLLYYTRRCLDCLENDQPIPDPIGIHNTRLWCLADWIEQPLHSDFRHLNLVESVEWLSHAMLRIEVAKGNKPNTYIERKFGRVFLCYMTLIEILGDLIYAKTE